MDTWGTLNLYLQEYERPETGIKLHEVEVITDPASSAPQTVLMGGGRRRKKRSVRGYAAKADFDSMETDMLNCTLRMVSFSDGFSMTALISEISGTMQPGSNYVWYAATFMET